MPSKKTLLKNCKLYLILDRDVCNYDRLFEIAREALKAGVDIIQLRDKKGSSRKTISFAQRILKITKHQIPFIMNDRVDLALAVGADGVHLGQEDMPVSAAKKILGPQVLIGKSCQNQRHVREAQAEGADYIGFGSVFKTLTKPERNPMDLSLLKRVIESSRIPVFAIGGINLKNVSQVVAMGGKRVAVCRCVCHAADIKKTVSFLKTNLENF